MKYLRACFLFKKALGYFFSLAILMSLVQSSVSSVTFGMVDLGWLVGWLVGWDGWFGMVD